MSGNDLLHWISMSKNPTKSGQYLVRFSKRNFNYDVDTWNAEISQWEFYNKEDMVEVKYYMAIPDMTEENTIE